jgi:hypothetical protein
MEGAETAAAALRGGKACNWTWAVHGAVSPSQKFHFTGHPRRVEKKERATTAPPLPPPRHIEFFRICSARNGVWRHGRRKIAPTHPPFASTSASRSHGGNPHLHSSPLAKVCEIGR